MAILILRTLNPSVRSIGAGGAGKNEIKGGKSVGKRGRGGEMDGVLGGRQVEEEATGGFGRTRRGGRRKVDVLSV